MRRAVLFDFDGVIVDSLDDLLRVNRMVHPELTLEDYRSVHEDNVFAGFEKARGRFSAPSSFDFFGHYNPSVIDQKAFPGMKESISELAAQYDLFVVSSGHDNVIEAWLQKHGLQDNFIRVLGSLTHKSKVEKMKMLAREHGIEGHNAVFITDTLGDIKEAREAGIDAIGVGWGFHPPELLAKGNPAAMVQKPADLTASIRSYFAARP